MHGFGERSFARRHRRGEKRAPLREAWKGSRLRAWSNTQNHCKVLRFRTRNSYHLPRIITTRTPFSPDRMRKRCKGCHCAQATERHRAQTTKSRQTPPQAKRCGFLEKTAPGAGGWDRGLTQPPPSPVSLFAVFQSHRTHLHISNLQARHAGPRGRRTSPACGSCRRPLKRNKDQGIEKTE